MGDEHITERIIGCAMKVHRILGPGFLEKIYRRAMLLELHGQNLRVETEKHVAIFYNGKKVGRHHLDLLVEEKVVVELKIVEALSKAHYAQLRSYLKASNLETGLLINFAGESLDFRRIQLIPLNPPNLPSQ